MTRDDYLYGMAYGCPKKRKGEFVEMDCPFLEIAHFSFLDKVKWIQNLSEEKKDAVLEQHMLCTNCKGKL